MSDNNLPVNRIPHESIVSDEVSSWSLPAMKGAVVKETANISEKSGMHVRGRTRAAVSGVKETIDVVAPEAKPKSLTADDLKKIAEDAHKEGYSEGYAEGLRKGTEKGLEKGAQQGKDQAYKETKSEMVDLQNRLRDIAKNLLSPMKKQDEVLENTIVDMAFFFAQSLLESEISQSPSKLYSIVNKALSVIPVGTQNISVHLNNKDADLLENILPKTDRSWNIHRDDSLKSGGCIVQSKESLVDYTIESRIKKFMEEVDSSSSINNDIENQDDVFSNSQEVQDVQSWRDDISKKDDKDSNDGSVDLKNGAESEILAAESNSIVDTEIDENTEKVQRAKTETNSSADGATGDDSPNELESDS